MSVVGLHWASPSASLDKSFFIKFLIILQNEFESFSVYEINYISKP